MRLLIIGDLNGSMVNAAKLAKEQNAKILHAIDIKSAMINLRNGENIELISENIIRFSVEFSEATLKELSYLKNTGETYSFLPDVEFLTSDLASSKNGPLLLNFLSSVSKFRKLTSSHSLENRVNVRKRFRGCRGGT